MKQHSPSHQQAWPAAVCWTACQTHPLHTCSNDNMTAAQDTRVLESNHERPHKAVGHIHDACLVDHACLANCCQGGCALLSKHAAKGKPACSIGYCFVSCTAAFTAAVAGRRNSPFSNLSPAAAAVLLLLALLLCSPAELCCRLVDVALGAANEGGALLHVTWQQQQQQQQCNQS